MDKEIQVDWTVCLYMCIPFPVGVAALRPGKQVHLSRVLLKQFRRRKEENLYQKRNPLEQA